MRDVPWEDVFKHGASASAADFRDWVQVRIEVYTPHRKYHIKRHSFLWFSAACTAAMAPRYHLLFVLTEYILCA